MRFNLSRLGGGNKMGEKNQLFREKTMERISSPEQLTDYLRVTNPGMWAVLIAVILLLGGIIAWAAVGVLEIGSWEVTHTLKAVK